MIYSFRIQDSWFRKRAVNHSLVTRQRIPWYIRSKKTYSEGTPTITFKWSGVSVLIFFFPKDQKLQLKLNSVCSKLKFTRVLKLCTLIKMVKLVTFRRSAWQKAVWHHLYKLVLFRDPSSDLVSTDMFNAPCAFNCLALLELKMALAKQY